MSSEIRLLAAWPSFHLRYPPILLIPAITSRQSTPKTIGNKEFFNSFFPDQISRSPWKVFWTKMRIEWKVKASGATHKWKKGKLQNTFFRFYNVNYAHKLNWNVFGRFGKVTPSKIETQNTTRWHHLFFSSGRANLIRQQAPSITFPPK